VPEKSTFTRRQFLLRVAKSETAASENQPIQQPLFQQRIKHIPQIEAHHWSLTLGGLVQTPIFLTYDDLLGLPVHTMTCVIGCINNKPGGKFIASAKWGGVALAELRNQLQVQPEARYARFQAGDGYVTSVKLEQLQDALLVYLMDDKPLLPAHGFPVRLIVPGLYGYKMPKWIQRISFSDTPRYGFWEEQGWSKDGAVQITSSILSPRHLDPVAGIIRLSGIAYAGQRGISQVEVNIDGGGWMSTHLIAGDRHDWTRWHIDWTPSAPGDYLVTVRATDSSGLTQPDNDDASVYPEGAKGTHRIIIRAQA
jgi:hypothetical protein